MVLLWYIRWCILVYPGPVSSQDTYMVLLMYPRPRALDQSGYFFGTPLCSQYPVPVTSQASICMSSVRALYSNTQKGWNFWMCILWVFSPIYQMSGTVHIWDSRKATTMVTISIVPSPSDNNKIAVPDDESTGNQIWTLNWKVYFSRNINWMAASLGLSPLTVKCTLIKTCG